MSIIRFSPFKSYQFSVISYQLSVTEKNSEPQMDMNEH